MRDRDKLRFKGNISLSRPMGMDRNYISICLKCENSNIEFVEARMSLSDFAEMLTGLSHVPMTFQPRGLEYVGKIK